MSVIATGPSNGIYTKQSTNVLGLGATVDAAGAFLASTGPVIRYVTSDPNGVVLDNAASLALAADKLYVSSSPGSWGSLTAAPAGAKGGYQRYAMTTQTLNVGDNTSGVDVLLPNSTVTFAAGSLVTGATIRYRLSGLYAVPAAAPGTNMVITTKLGASTILSPTITVAANSAVYVVSDVQVTVLSAGGAGVLTASWQGSYSGNASTNAVYTAALDTTIANDLNVYIRFNNAFVGTNFDFLQYNVDFYP